MEKHHIRPFSNFYVETVGDTEKKLVEFLVGLSEMNNFQYRSDSFLSSIP